MASSERAHSFFLLKKFNTRLDVVRECIASALAQDWEPLEILVVDDGSTDESPAIIRSFGDRIRTFSTAHQGGNVARNLLLREARGSWIQYLDADDYLLPGKISRQLEEGGGLSEVDVLCGPVWREDYTRERLRSLAPDPVVRPPDPCRQVLFTLAPQTNGVLWRKTALEAIGGVFCPDARPDGGSAIATPSTSRNPAEEVPWR